MGAIGKKVLVVAICVLVLAGASFAIRKLAQSNVDRESAARADAEVQKRKAEAVIQPPSLSLSGASKDKGPAKPTLGRSTGCGKSATGTGDFARTTIRVLGRDRTYHLRLPHTYDPNRAYPLVFRWHGSGGDGLSGGLDIELSSVNDAIVVGADGLNKEWVIGTRAHDLAFFDAMLEAVSKRYCIDRDRVFSYGFSDGGFITNDLACRRGDVLMAARPTRSMRGTAVCATKDAGPARSCGVSQAGSVTAPAATSRHRAFGSSFRNSLDDRGSWSELVAIPELCWKEIEGTLDLDGIDAKARALR